MIWMVNSEVKTEILLSEVIRNRIMKLEYGKLTEWKIRQIFLEETGQELPASIDVYYSDEFIEDSDSYGFDGTIIHFFDEVKGINQAYTITRGSEKYEEKSWKPSDWIYNLMGIFVGKNAGQYEAAIKFDQQVTKKIDQKVTSNIELKKMGLGHSLGGNLIIILQLTTNWYDSVYATNPAPPSYYQLANIDRGFKEALQVEFNINPFDSNAIYEINKDELKTFAEKYYKEAGQDINITIANQDILYAISNVRGFIKVGNVDFIDAYPGKNIDSLKPLFDKLPDDVLQAIQVYLATNLSEVYNEEGLMGFLRELTGVNGQLIDDFLGYEGFDYVKNSPHLIKEGYNMIKDMQEKVPILLGHINALRENVEPILDTFIELGYMTEKEKKTVMTEIDGLENDVEELAILVRNAFKFDLGSIGRIIKLFGGIEDILNRMSNRVDTIFENTKVLRELIHYGGDAHGLARVIDALGGKGRHFHQGDLIIAKSINGVDISVNISSATRIFMTGTAFMDAKLALLNQMKSYYEEEYLEHYKERKSNLSQKINDMESSPSNYQYLLGKFTYDTQLFYRLTNINVHEDIGALPYNGFQAVFDNLFAYMESDIIKDRAFLDDVKDSIEKFFEVDQKIANRLGAL